MFNRVPMCAAAAFLCGVVVGVAGIVCLGGGRGPAAGAAARASAEPASAPVDPKEAARIGRYQAFKLDQPSTNTLAGLIDTATGKVWALRPWAKNDGSSGFDWYPVAEGPK